MNYLSLAKPSAKTIFRIPSFYLFIEGINASVLKNL